MAEETQTQPPENNDTDSDKPFWDKLGSFMDERIDAGVERALQKHGTIGRSRNEGKTTVPGFFAQLMGGPFAPDKKKD